MTGLAYDGALTTGGTFPQVKEVQRFRNQRHVSAGHKGAASSRHPGKGPRAEPVSTPLTEVDQGIRVVAHACHGKNPQCRCTHPEGTWALWKIPCTACGCTS
jgi:hypothetical protein